MRGVMLWFSVMLALILASPLQAQESESFKKTLEEWQVEVKGEEEKDPLIRVTAPNVTTMKFGAGLSIKQDVDTLELNGFSVSTHWLGVELPFDVDTGLEAELTFPMEGGAVTSFWNLNRKAINGMFYTGVDLKINDLFFNNPPMPEGVHTTYSTLRIRNDFNFDQRIVVGMKVYHKWDVELEVYMLEDNRPVAFSVMFNPFN